MNLLKHFLVVLLLACGMVTWLYSYKPRNYNTIDLVINFVVNISLWLVIFGVPYLLVSIIVVLIKRHFFK